VHTDTYTNSATTSNNYTSSNSYTDTNSNADSATVDSDTYSGPTVRRRRTSSVLHTNRYRDASARPSLDRLVTVAICSRDGVPRRAGNDVVVEAPRDKGIARQPGLV